MDYDFFKRKFAWLTGFDLDSYKDKQMERRIQQFIRRMEIDSYDSYYKLLESSDQEKIRFLNFLTINQTSFFRDLPVFKNIKNNVLPEILERKKARIKIWSAGCSNGAEAYSLSILMFELIGNGTQPYRYCIVATDIDSQVLKQAELGLFPVNLLDNVSKKSREKYFFPVGDKLQIKPEIKKRVIFRQHDLLKDEYEDNCDLILCRNVFIYFKPETQQKLLAKFMEALNPRGYFITGSSEHVSSYHQWGLEKKHMAIYQKVK